MSSNDVGKLPITQRLKFLAKDSVLYGGASAIERSLALITFPLLARYFSIQEYGWIDLFAAWVMLFSRTLVFGQDSAVARYYYEYEDTESRRQLISQSLILQVCLILLILPIILIVGPAFIGTLVQSPDARHLMRLALLQVPFIVLTNFSQNLLKWTFRRRAFMTVSLGSSCVFVVGLVICARWFTLTIEALYFISISTKIIFAMTGLWLSRKWLTMPTNFKFMREMLPFAVPYGFIGLIGTIVPVSERSITAWVLGARELGAYAVAAKMALLLNLIVQAFQMAWGPFSMSLYKQRDAIHTYNLVLKIFTLIMCLCTLGAALFAPALLALLTANRYAEGAMVVFPLAMVVAVQAIGWVTSIGIGFSKKSYLTLYAYLVYLPVSLGSMFLLGHHYGLAGIAFGSLIGYIARAALETVLAQRAHPMSWSYGRPLMIMASTITIGSLLYQIPSMLQGTTQWLTATTVYAALCVVAFMVTFGRSERARMLKSFTGRSRA